MKGLSTFSRTTVEDEQDKHDDVLQNEKDPSSLETMSAEMTSLKSRLLCKEEEVQSLKDMVAQKDEEIKRLKELLRVRDLKVDVLRADIESAWKKFGTFLSITSPERSKNEIKHVKDNISNSDDEDEDIFFKSDDEDEGIFKSDDEDERSKNEIKHEKEPGEEEIKGMARKQDEIRFQPGPPRQSYLSKVESDLVGAECSDDLICI